MAKKVRQEEVEQEVRNEEQVEPVVEVEPEPTRPRPAKADYYEKLFRGGK